MTKASITGLLLFQLILLAAPSIGRAAAPPLVPIQGYLTDDADMPLNGVYKISFTLFDANAAGTSLFATTEPVTLTKGRFTVYLGDKQQMQLDKLHHANAVWLEVTIVQSCASDATCASPTPVNKTLTPRLQLASTAYAASAAFCSSADNAQAVGGMSVTELQPKIADVACGPNMFVSALRSGLATCTSAPATSSSSGPAPVQSSLPDVACPAGQLLSGIQGGQPVCVPRPTDGKDGVNGQDGKDGVNGANGTDGTLTTSNVKISTFTASANSGGKAIADGFAYCALAEVSTATQNDGRTQTCSLEQGSGGHWELAAITPTNSSGGVIGNAYCRMICFGL